MKSTTISEKEMRRRKLLLVLPIAMLPFITLLFWVGGGGKAEAVQAGISKPQGLNTKVPDAKLKEDSALNKMGYYDRAASDSAKLRQLMKADPYYKEHLATDSMAVNSAVPDIGGQGLINERSTTVTSQGTQAVETALNRKLARLQATIDQPTTRPEPVTTAYPKASPAEQIYAGYATNREDPELKQMNSLLERILDIQHPERVMQKADSNAASIENFRFKAIPAVVDGKQKITEGTVVRLKLLDTVTINGQLIPKGQLLYGTGRLYNQRLALTIKLIRIGNMILPADLTVFDMTDGLEGISVPEAITDDAVRSGAANGVQSMEFMSLDPSFSAQLAGAGVNAAKGLFNKKVKRIKAKLSDGHLLLLRDNTKSKALRQ
ncbi:conjugative transposon protein TraM [Mucilaginibacter litoreus]|uniref:Conjugative transposon protein TraM n=1 Tax=Mucilaginibacter litoreus TaxID=1048221 RepID=A0ABW3AWM3_9SPHI